MVIFLNNNLKNSSMYKKVVKIGFTIIIVKFNRFSKVFSHAFTGTRQ